MFTLTVEVGDGTTLTTETVTINLSDVNEAPFQVTNLVSAVNEGAADPVTLAELEYRDPEQGAANVTYTVNTAPLNGQLLLGGVPTASFTQADITGGLVSYQHDGSETANDSFTFTASDGVGGSLAGQSFTFAVTPVNDAPVNPVPGPRTTGLNPPPVFSGANLLACRVPGRSASRRAWSGATGLTSQPWTSSGTPADAARRATSTMMSPPPQATSRSRRGSSLPRARRSWLKRITSCQTRAATPEIRFTRASAVRAWTCRSGSSSGASMSSGSRCRPPRSGSITWTRSASGPDVPSEKIPFSWVSLLSI